MKGLYTFCRYFAALLIIQYGFAKINDAQFTVLQSVLDQPLREVSGFWLTWYYFGYSEVYGNLIALVQIAGGVMLLFRKTTLLGACFLLGVMTNIVLVNIFFGIDFGATIVALLITACLLFVLWQHRSELVQLFWSAQNTLYPSSGEATGKHALKWTVRALVVLLPAAFTYWIANYNNRSPTPIDGAWRVEEVEGVADTTTHFPSRIYFERNRAYMSVFAYADSSRTHHFEVNEDEKVLEIWEQWLRKGDKVFSGEYDLTENRLELRGTLEVASVPVRVELVRIDDGT